VSQGSEGNPPLRIRLSREQWAEVRRRAGDEHPATWARRVLLGPGLGEAARPGRRPRDLEVTYSGPPVLPRPALCLPEEVLRRYRAPDVAPTLSIGPVPAGATEAEVVAMVFDMLEARGESLHGLRAGELEEATSTWTFEVVRPQRREEGE
jgi:hypothetical protein